MPRRKYPFHALQVGESFLWPISNRDGTYSWRKHNAVRGSAYQLVKNKVPKRFSVYQVLDEDGKWFVEVTRVE